MNKEEILNLSKKENKRLDEMQQDVIVNACNKAYRIARFLCAFIIAFDGIVNRNINYAVFSIFMVMTGIYLFYKDKASKTKYEFILSIVYLLIGISLFCMYIYRSLI